MLAGLVLARKVRGVRAVTLPPAGRCPLRASGRAQRDLDRLLSHVEALAGEIRRLEDELADPDLFRRDQKAFAARTTRLARARDDLQAAEQRWLDLAARQQQVT